MKNYIFLLTLLSIFLIGILYIDNVDPFDPVSPYEFEYGLDGFLAVSFIITYKYRIHNVIDYCSVLVDEEVAFSSEIKWVSANKIYYDAAKLKYEHYINYIKENNGADAADFRRNEYDQLFLTETDDFVSEYFSGIDGVHNIKNKCYSFINEINTGVHDIFNNEEVADDLRKLMFFAQKQSYNKSVKQTE